ncbi:alpha/beta hydrolase [bacterium]|nr:alpha/beta hydrolase [bacterium]
MDNLRCYGEPPYSVVLVHGGPGVAGTMAPVARELAARYGVLEPLQTAASVTGQVTELRAQIAKYAAGPVVLIGSSWGAMLAFVLAAKHPEMVAKLVLVGSGVYTECHARQIEATRFERLTPVAMQTAYRLMGQINQADSDQQNNLFAQLGKIFTQTDAYDPVTLDLEWTQIRYDIYKKVWPQAVALRRQGDFLKWGRRIQCPVIALHGDYDPHPAAGIHEPLAAVVRDFQFILLEKCGHLPWIEKQAKAVFYQKVNEIVDAQGWDGKK